MASSPAGGTSTLVASTSLCSTTAEGRQGSTPNDPEHTQGQQVEAAPGGDQLSAEREMRCPPTRRMACPLSSVRGENVGVDPAVRARYPLPTTEPAWEPHPPLLASVPGR